MDIYDTRVSVIRQWIEDVYKTKAEFARAVRLPDNYISRVLSTGKNRKKIGEKMARKIEHELRKPPYSLDGRHASQVAETKSFYGHLPTIEELEVGIEWGKLEEPAREQLRTMIYTLVGAQVRKARKPAKSGKRAKPEPESRRTQ